MADEQEQQDARNAERAEVVATLYALQPFLKHGYVMRTAMPTVEHAANLLQRYADLLKVLTEVTHGD